MPTHRASAPPPLSTYSSGGSSGRSSDLGSEHPIKAKSKHRSMSDGWFDHKGSSSSRSSHNRTTSDLSVRSSSSKPSSPTKNVYTHCGRHTDQYLLGGRSMTDLVRNIFTKKD